MPRTVLSAATPAGRMSPTRIGVPAAIGFTMTRTWVRCPLDEARVATTREQTTTRRTPRIAPGRLRDRRRVGAGPANPGTVNPSWSAVVRVLVSPTNASLRLSPF